MATSSNISEQSCTEGMSWNALNPKQCVLCPRKGGGLISCKMLNCMQRYHPLCAQTRGIIEVVGPGIQIYFNTELCDHKWVG